MPNDIQDWTAAVNVQAGTVTIGSGTVSISGTPTVNINAGQSVAISGTPNVVISGTPNVSISGTPTVILGAGTASVGSVSAINSTVTVAGTINIGNTPAVTISGTPSVNISSGSVAITGGTINIQTAAGISVSQEPLLLNGQTSTFLLNAGAGTTTNLVPAVAGKVVTLHRFSLQIQQPQPNSTIRLNSTDSNNILRMDSGSMEPVIFEFHGQQLAVGLGVDLINASNGTVSMVQDLLYTQV